VVIADWRGDWVGLGIAEMLVRAGHQVRLCVDGFAPGQSLMNYVRDQWNGRLHELGIETVTYARLFGADRESVFFQHGASGNPIILDGVDTLVLATGHRSERTLEDSLGDFSGEVHVIGDCLNPRTAEEAVLEGLKAGVTL
jgi:NADPH-dependent 2,4-dienoyl-CoA reductase/sulfur reductase-like enzyme